MSEHNTRGRLTPTCPHCGHAMTDDDMCSNAYRPGDDCDDLWALPTREERTYVICPAVGCELGYYVQGGYTPRYTSAVKESDLD